MYVDDFDDFTRSLINLIITGAIRVLVLISDCLLSSVEPIISDGISEGSIGILLLCELNQHIVLGLFDLIWGIIFI